MPGILAGGSGGGKHKMIKKNAFTGLTYSNKYLTIIKAMREVMTDKQKIELKRRFTIHGSSVSVLQWMVMTPAFDNNEVWDCYEEWQDEDEEN